MPDAMYQPQPDVRAASIGSSFIIKILVWITTITLLVIDTANGMDALDGIVNMMYTF